MVNRRRFIALTSFIGASLFLGFGRKAFAERSCKGHVGEWSWGGDSYGSISYDELPSKNMNGLREYRLNVVEAYHDSMFVEWDYSQRYDKYTCKIYVDDKLWATEDHDEITNYNVRFRFGGKLMSFVFSHGKSARFVLSSGGKFLGEASISLANFEEAWNKSDASISPLYKNKCEDEYYKNNWNPWGL